MTLKKKTLIDLEGLRLLCQMTLTILCKSSNFDRLSGARGASLRASDTRRALVNKLDRHQERGPKKSSPIEKLSQQSL